MQLSYVEILALVIIFPHWLSFFTDCTIYLGILWGESFT